jgi:uncharacterized protein (TIGR00730 family)
MKKKHPLKAYKNSGFLNAKDARPIRILSEFLEPLSRFRYFGVKDTVVFFGSARIRSRTEAQKELHDVRKQIKKLKRTSGRWTEKLSSAKIKLEMSRYYEDAVALAQLITKWSRSLREENRFIICSGGGPGIMEAANKGAQLAGGKSIGLNISLPKEQYPNPFITPELNFEFHYFFMRKYWFMYLGKALIAFPGGFGTMDELMELLTLLQTGKIKKKMSVILYGKDYWRQIINLDALERLGMIGKQDRMLFRYADTPSEAFTYLKKELTRNYLADSTENNNTHE